MLTALKKFIIAILVLAVSAGIFFLVEQDREIKEDVLRRTLDIFGKQLLAMIREGENKAEVEKRYNEFLIKAEQDKVPEEEIERVVATILNLSTQDTIINADEAIAVLSIVAPESPPTLELEEEEPEELGYLKSRPPKKRPLRQRPLDRNRLAERLRRINEFQIKVRELSKEKGIEKNELRKNLVFAADSGLKVVMCMDFKKELDRKKYRELHKQLGELERQHLITWHQNFEKDLQRQMFNLHVQLDQLKDLEFIPTMKKLEFMQMIDADSIAAVVIESLEEAGIIPDTCK